MTVIAVPPVTANVIGCFFMTVILLGIFGHEIPDSVKFPIAMVFSLGCGLSGSFLGGSAAAQGKIPIPGINKHPITFAVTGGTAITVMILGLSYWLYLHPKSIPLTVQQLFSIVENRQLSNQQRAKAFLQLVHEYGWNDFTGRNLSGLSLPKSNLAGLDFTEANLEKCNLRESSLRNAKFVRADMCGAILFDCDLRESKFNAAILEGANCESANFYSAELRAGNYSGEIFHKANLERANFEATDISNADFSNSRLDYASFNDPPPVFRMSEN